MKTILKTLQSLIPFLEPYPIWVKSIVVVWIALSAALIASLLLAKTKKEEATVILSPASIEPQPSETKPSIEIERNIPKKSSTLSMVEYFEKYERIKDRFYEKDQFIEELRNTKINWKGYVLSVQKSYKNGVAVTLDTNEIATGKTVFIHFPESLATKAYALQKGDQIEFSGEIYGGPPTKPEIRGASFSLFIK